HGAINYVFFEYSDFCIKKQKTLSRKQQLSLMKPVSVILFTLDLLIYLLVTVDNHKKNKTTVIIKPL
ncbi:MAG: hypothetical protein L0I86_01145, partial [Enterobacterales bacterium]|nr:hypothetical protein [Enterobacterales bacterium]